MKQDKPVVQSDALVAYQNEIEGIADQLCKAVRGDFSFIIKTGSLQESIQKLTMLINFVMDAARRALLSIEEKNSKLTELDQLKSDFLSNISHELRTPLTLILGPLQTILSDFDSIPSEHRENLRRMQRNALRLYMLVNDVLDFSKLEANKFVVHEECIDLNKVVSNMVGDAQGLANDRNISLVLSECPALEVVWLDRKMVEKILMNLVGNALKFTPQGGRIDVQLKKTANIVQLIIHDTGIGIPETEIPRLFERFHQVNSSSTRTYEGTGIGLAITKQFVELLQGSITVESELNKGTKFIVELPIKQLSTQQQSVILKDNELLQTDPIKSIDTSMSLLVAQQHTTHDKLTGTLPLILIVDDNDDMRSYTGSLLKHTYEIITAKNGKLALEAIYKYHPQVILSDVMMPIMDGYQLTMAVKHDPDIKHIPIILVTAKSGGGSITSGLTTGADDYLSKPFLPEELIARVNVAFRSYQNYVRLQELNIQMAQQASLASIGQLAAGIAHEINNPMTFVANNMGVLKKYISTFKIILEKHKQFFSQIEDQSAINEIIELEEAEKLNFILSDTEGLINESIEGTKRVIEIVKGLKVFSRVDMAQQNKININECIESTIHLMRHEFKYDRKLKKELAPLPVIPCCPSQLNQVIMNLLMNALQAIEKEGTITVATNKMKDHIVMKISDTGCGIPQENIEKLFNPFFTTKPVGEGTGLGLSISYGIIKKHGGDIMVSSIPGQGSVFEVRLPIGGVH